MIFTDITARYPPSHPHAGRVAPNINCPIALPADPVPSIIPVIVEIAFSLPYKVDYFPRSAAQTEEIILFREFIKNPWHPSIITIDEYPKF